MFIHVGIDDTDSRGGQCTTYIASKIISKLINQVCSGKYSDYFNWLNIYKKMGLKINIFVN